MLRAVRFFLSVFFFAAMFFSLAPRVLWAEAREVGAPVPSALPASLAAEISRLERLVSGGSAPLSSPPREQYDAFLTLTRLHCLAGNPEAALACLERALKFFPADGGLLFEQARLLISTGEFEKAAVCAAALLGKGGDAEYLRQGRLLFAQIEAFRSGNIRPLADLAAEGDFSAARGAGLYYTLWKISGDNAWKVRLAGEFPRSPEARIAAASGGAAATAAGSAAAVVPGAAPLWLLFPGRESIGAGAVPPGAVQTAPQASTPPALSGTAPSPPATALQTGLFAREENAQALARRLGNSGFEPRIVRRTVSGGDYWAVHVSGGSNVNAMIKKLKDAGFDSFPVK